jgi:hypothetical protein
MTPTAPAVPRRLTRLYRRLQRQMAHLAETADLPAEEVTSRAETVSAWAPAQHLEHLAITGGEVLDAVEACLAGKGREAAGGPSLSGRLVLTLGWIPRGAGKARDRWSPADADPGRARQAVASLAARLDGLEPRLGEIAQTRAALPHPIFRAFTPVQWLRFLEVHQSHHLKIVRDIRRARSGRLNRSS